MQTDFDVIVIGAGPAGSIASARLHKEGFSVFVLEKLEFPRFVIGESLLPHCMDHLDELDLLDCVVAKNFQLKTGVTFDHDDERCQFLFSNKFSDGWDYTYQVKRADFDHALIEEVERKGVKVEFNAEVTAVETSSEIQHITYLNKSGETKKVSARYIIDASGYGRVLPRLFDLDKPAPSSPRGAVFSHVKDENRTDKAAENIFVHDFNNNTAWIWAIPFSDKTASVGVVGDVDLVNEFAEGNGEKFQEFIRNFPGITSRFINTDFLFEPRAILNYSVSIKKFYGDGFILCGNSTEFLDPVFSSGVTLAMSSGHQAAKLVCQHLKGNQVDWEKDYVEHMNFGINVFRTYVNSWYNGDLQTIFFTKQDNTEIKKQICSVLAGYVWDTTNPFVKKHATMVNTLAKVIRINENQSNTAQ
jgi:flavin-dependent dehydrogenase